MSLASMQGGALDAPSPIGFTEKIWRINWGLVLVLTAIAGIGVLALYSAAGGRFDPWASRHAMRYVGAFGVMLVTALVPPRVWLALAWPIYVAVSDRWAYVADTVNRRVVRVKLGYAAEATAAVP